MKFFLSWKRLLPFRRPLKQIAAPVVEVMKADETSVVVVSGLDLSPPDAPLVEIEPAPLEIAAAPDPQPVAEIDTPATLPLPPATIPLSLPPPAYPDDWMRARAMYFSSGAYSQATHVERILSPDLVFRLGADSRRSIAEPRTPPAGQPPVPGKIIAPTPPARLLDVFSTSTETSPQPDVTGVVANVDPLLLSLVFSDREAGPAVPEPATAEYLTQPVSLAHALQLRDRVLQHWSSGGAPLSPSDLYTMARQIVSHQGTALLIAHNVSKAFARGGDAIHWQLTNRTRGEYTDGANTYLASTLHRAGVLKTGPFANPSIFYALFSAKEFGTGDPGDYYRFFAAAAVAWYAAAGQSRIPIVPPTEAAREFAQSMVDAARQLQDSSVELSPSYRGWLWANSIGWIAGASSQAGASFGLREASTPESPAWRWQVPPPAASPEMHLSLKTIQKILNTASPHIRRDFNGSTFTIIFTVEEGMACRFTTSDWAGASTAEPAQDVIDELGWNIVERSSRRQVVIRCPLPAMDPAQAQCECDRGSGFEPLKIQTRV